MKSVAIVTADGYLFQKLRLELLESRDFFVHTDASDCDICFLDADTAKTEDASGRVIRLSRYGKEGCAPLPLPIGEAIRLAGVGSEGAILSLLASERCAVLRGERIRLTEIEFSLISALYERGGEYCTREELMRRVWKSEGQSGVINVYIHYLREKLEGRGEKIIISSRKNGYAIDGKYLGGAIC